MSAWIQQPLCPPVTQTCVQHRTPHTHTHTHTHTHGHRDAGSVSCEWWSVGMRGWGIGNWLAWRIKGLHVNQERTSWLTETSLKWTVRRNGGCVCVCVSVCVCVCVCVCACERERERSTPEIDSVQHPGWCVFFISGHSVRLRLYLHHLSLISSWVCASHTLTYKYKCTCRYQSDCGAASSAWM